MKLSHHDWPALASYLLIERKFRGDQGPTKSRFYLLASYLAKNDLEFNKTNFNVFLFDKKESGARNAYLNKFIGLAKHIAAFWNIPGFESMTYFKEDKIAIDCLTVEEIEKIINYNPGYYYSPEYTFKKYSILFSLLAKTGCRIGEALSLTWNDVTSDTITFRDTKNGDTRVVYNPTPDIFDLKLKLKGNVFQSYRGDSLTPQAVREELNSRCEKVGITKNIYPHIFRHTFITLSLQNGMDISMVALIVGHKNLESTRHYTHYVIEDMKNAVYSYHPLMKSQQTFHTISDRIKTLIDSIVDKKNISVTMKEDSNSLSITVQRSCYE